MKMKKKNKTGFTLSYALLVISIVLSISMTISEIVLREIVISGFGRDSLVAFFAADSGVECALYWDVKQNAFATSSTSSTINCADSVITFNPSSGISEFDLNFANGAFSHVKVDKTAPPLTAIIANGRNSSDLTNPRRVERGLKVTY